MNKTGIEWVKNPGGTQGYTWNPITGCLNHANGLCKGGGFPCYAYRLANGRLKPLYLANKNWDTRTPEGYEDYPNLAPFYPRFWPERLGQLYWDEAPYHKIKRCKPRGIFVCDMSDLFGIGIPEEWTRRILKEIENKAFWETGDRFYLLTKQPQNLVKWSPFPDNCWVGVTITRSTLNPDTDMFDRAMNGLSAIEAKVKYISFEPLLDWEFEVGCHDLADFLSDVVDWLIIGAQTRPYKPPKIEWVEEIVTACDKAGIPVFLKDNLGDLPARLPFYRAEDDGGWELRQEMPND